MSGRWRRAVIGRVAATARGRRVLEPLATRLADRAAGREIERALANAVYDDRYYEGGAEGVSGYSGYSRATSNADSLAWLVWSAAPAKRALDVGCASGYVVEALGDLGIDAEGVDVSEAAIRRASPSVRARLRAHDLRDPLPYPDREFGLVTALETLEHLPTAAVPGALAELARVAAERVVATIPSFGPNPYGFDGWFHGKVRPERLEHYQTLGPAYDGPVPRHDLAVDAEGLPVEGHLTVASYRWWTERFEEAGLVRCGDLELVLGADVARLGLAKYVCLYVLRPAGTPAPEGPARSPAERVAAAERLGLDLSSGPVEEIVQAEARLPQPGPRPA